MTSRTCGYSSRACAGIRRANTNHCARERRQQRHARMAVRRGHRAHGERRQCPHLPRRRSRALCAWSPQARARRLAGRHLAADARGAIAMAPGGRLQHRVLARHFSRTSTARIRKD